MTFMIPRIAPDMDDFEDSDGLPFVLAKLVLLLLTALAVHVSLSPPNPPVRSDEQCCSGTDKTHTFFEIFVQSITLCSKCMVWLGTLVEIWALCFPVPKGTQTAVAVSVSSSSLAGSVGSAIRGLDLIPHPTMIFGAFFTTLGALLRLWCFRTMGPLFTFEISLRPRHELITHGPYSWVRHPSYTGVYMTLIGATLVFISPGTWTFNCGFRTVIGGVLGLFWLFKCSLAFRGMIIRIRIEDGILKEAFKEEWLDYAEKVPYKLVPGCL